MATHDEIAAFLFEFKQAIIADHWSIVQRRVAYAQISEMPVSSIKIVLLSLTPAEYASGPDADRDRSGEYLWVFHRPDGERPYFYIKLKMDHGSAKVISFHRTIY